MLRIRSGPASFLCAALLLTATMALADGRFVSGIADLPLMPGLEEIEESAMVFSKPEGRIVEVMARGAVTREAASAFYDQTLPQLGWRPHRAGDWRRENEILRLDMKDGEYGVVIQFTLTPQ